MVKIRGYELETFAFDRQAGQKANALARALRESVALYPGHDKAMLVGGLGSASLVPFLHPEIPMITAAIPGSQDWESSRLIAEASGRKHYLVPINPNKMEEYTVMVEGVTGAKRNDPYFDFFRNATIPRILAAKKAKDLGFETVVTADGEDEAAGVWWPKDRTPEEHGQILYEHREHRLEPIKVVTQPLGLNLETPYTKYPVLNISATFNREDCMASIKTPTYPTLYDRDLARESGLANPLEQEISKITEREMIMLLGYPADFAPYIAGLIKASLDLGSGVGYINKDSS